jgi:peptidoglycan/LPS O-acetylase OafA/YrhL
MENHVDASSAQGASQASRINFAQVGQIKEFDGLRGIAILMVLCVHFWPQTSSIPWFDAIASSGWVGVDLFFVLSGCLITWILVDTKKEEHYFRNFYGRRILRIFPLYFLFLAFIFIAIPIYERGPYWSSPFIQETGSPAWYFFFLTNLRELFSGNDVPPIIRPLWSLAIEEQFYLIFPWIVLLLSRRFLMYGLATSFLLAIAFRTITILIWPEAHRIQYLATVARMDAIAAGCLTALCLRILPFSTIRTFTSIAILFMPLTFVLGVTFHLFDRTNWHMRTWGYSALAISFGLVTAWTFAFRGARFLAPLRWRPLCFTGKICFGIYVLHRLVEFLLEKLFMQAGWPLREGSFVTLGLKVVVCIAVAALSWYAFERQILRMKKLFVYRLERRPAK